MEKPPKVTVGIPVYNGQKYLERCLECYLGQTLEDCEILIADNGSSDETSAICERYAAKDARVKIHRADKNRGASWNYNRLLDLCRSPYFKWAASDDLVSPDYLEKCVAALEANPDLILAYGATILIDGEGKETDRYVERIRIDSPRASHRLREYLLKVGLTNAIYGVIRIGELRATLGLGYFASSDIVLLAELAMRGRFAELAGTTFYRRLHENAYVSNKSWSQKSVWFDPRNAGKLILPTWIHLAAYIRSIRRTPMPAGERLRCYAVFAHRESWETGRLWNELLMGLRVKLFGMPKEAF